MDICQTAPVKLSKSLFIMVTMSKKHVLDIVVLNSSSFLLLKCASDMIINKNKTKQQQLNMLMLMMMRMMRHSHEQSRII